MSILRDYSMLLINIHGMPCCNRCRHCWAIGSPDHPIMPFTDIKLTLQSLAEFRDENQVWAMPLFFKEPTIHPDFIEIVRSMKQHGFINEATFWATNGFGIARWDESQWLMLKDLGLDGLQFTFYGKEENHDLFAGRAGAYRDAMAAIDNAIAHGLTWSAGLIAHQGNLTEIRPMIQMLKDKSRKQETRIGWMLPSYQGRGRSIRKPTLQQMQQAGLLEQENKWWRTESTHVREIKDTITEAEKRFWQIGCTTLTFDLDADLNLYCGGACDSNGILGLMPEIKEELKLGNLREMKLGDAVNRLFDHPPQALQMLWEQTAGELAEKYGDTGNQELYNREDLVKNKWGVMALKNV